VVGSQDDLEDLAAVFAGFHGFLQTANASAEMGHLLRETVVPDFLEHGEGVALGGRGFFDRIAVAGLAVGQQGAATEQVGAGEAVGTVDFALVVDAAVLGPTVLGQTDAPAFVLYDAEAMVFAPGLVGVYVGPHLRIDALDRRLAEDPAGELDAVAAHVEQDAAARAVYIPEPGHVWSGMLFALFDQEGLADGPFLDELFGPHVLGGEAQLLGVHE